jgi:uncharacterized membrane protein
MHYHSHDIAAPHPGYVQAIDFDGLLRMAGENDYLIHLQLRPGQFVVAASTLAIVDSEEKFAEDLTEGITGAFIVGSHPTPEQDAEYSIHQLVEVAIRALSPGINDPFTAIACIDQLTSALCRLAGRRFPASSLFDDHGRLRLRLKPITYSGMLNASFDQIRQYGGASVAVTIRLLEGLTLIAGQSRRPEQRMALHRQANMILRASREKLFERNDLEDVRERYRLLLQALNEFDDKEGVYGIPE